MKESTRLLLEEEIKSGKYAYDIVVNPNSFLEMTRKQDRFRNLFEMYLKGEFDDVNIFLKTFCHTYLDKLEFFQFLNSHIDDFRITEQVLAENSMDNPEYLLRRDVERATSRVTSRLYERGLVNMYQQYVNIALGVVGKEGDLLEVGSGGAMPISSLLFARELGKVTSLDEFSAYWNDCGFLNNMGIDTRSEMFNENTDITGYNAIVSRKACGGAISVIDKLANNGGEQVYFQQLCDCESPSKEDKMKNLLDWLSSKDQGMKSFSVKRNPLGQLELYINWLDNDNGLAETYVTNSPMHVDDIAQIINDRY